MITKTSPMKNSPNPPKIEPTIKPIPVASAENDTSMTEKVSPGVPSQSTAKSRPLDVSNQPTRLKLCPSTSVDWLVLPESLVPATC